MLTKYKKFGMKSINGSEAGEYEKDIKKIKINADDNLLLNKILNLYNLTIDIRSVFQEDNKYYPQVFFTYIVV